ncbi:DUF6328 family protein [Streptomyces luteogriseus]|uniref:DUF6328 family protein n=1 Tax=Streptomyces luteogriseus TaxID=68233 RepID=UPI003822D3EE
MPERDTGSCAYPCSHGRAPPCTARNETPLRRADRTFVELLQELRVTRTGVQILFFFPLAPALAPRFEELDALQRVTYVSALPPAVLAAALFAAAAHRRTAVRAARGGSAPGGVGAAPVTAAGSGGGRGARSGRQGRGDGPDAGRAGRGARRAPLDTPCGSRRV